MSRSLVGFLFVALLASGCSFLQDWSEYRSDDGEDAGPRDAGSEDAGTDAGFDAGPDACNECLSEGCEPTDPVVCQFDPTDTCFHCIGATEGMFCGDDSECDGELVCEFGRCLYECGTRADCETISSVGNECAPSYYGRTVCIGHDCDPVSDSCSPGEVCAVALAMDESEDLGSICAYPSGSIVGPGDMCAPPDDVCGPQLACVDTTGAGILTCERRCYGESMCDAGYVCRPLSGPTGTLTYQGVTLGVCAADPCPGVTCGPGQRCDWDGTCVTGCSTDADCGPTSRCLWERCLTPCTDSTECGAGSTCLPEGVCLAGCANPAANLCADGMTACEDRNGDGILECIP